MSILREKNLRSLRTTDAALAELLETTEPSAVLEVLPSRSGDLVPAVRRRGRSIALHSLFDPIKEATRLAATVLSVDAGPASPPDFECYLLFEGLGGGYQVRQILARAAAAYVLVIESDLALLSELLSKIDLSDILGDHRLHLLVDVTPGETAAVIRSTYLPGVMGAFFSVPLRARVDLEPDYFAQHRSSIRRALEDAANDFTVQAGFGRLWTRNILTNLPFLERRSLPPPGIDEAIVTAAGPSLEERIGEIARLRPGRYLIATDTSLPALLAAGQLPDAVLTIDCQYLSYYHFLAGLPATTVLVAELAAPPAITRLADRLVVVSSGHPLSRLAASVVGGIVPIDTSGGNVTHAAVSLAFELGAKSVHLLGSDFSYPFGKAYSRGTYLFDYFAERESRFAPTEAGMASLLYRNPTVEREKIPGGIRYTTQTLRAYRDRFLRSFAERRGSVHPLVSNGLPLDFPLVGPALGNTTVTSRGHDHRTTARQNGNVRRFLSNYRDAVTSLPNKVPEPFRVMGGGHEMEQWNIFATLYPLIARLRKDAPSETRAETLVSHAKKCVAAMVERVLERWYQ